MILLVVAVAALAVWYWYAHRRATGPGITPAVTGTGDKTVQRPKARPWRG